MASNPPGKFSMNLSRAGTKPNSLGLSGSAGLQTKPATGTGVGVGLSLAGKKPGGLAKPRAAPAPAFGGGSDLDDDLDDDAAERKKLLQRGGAGGAYASSSLNRAAIEQAKQDALQQDASAFDYDGVYDEMQQSRSSRGSASASAKPKEEKQQSRYIGGIMAAHKVREMENEKLFERKLVKEAEAEAHLYGDKERFMTSAYKRKIAERDEYEADLKRREAEEAANDVTKRSGLGDFYSNLLHGNVGSGGAASAAGGGGDGGDGGGGGSGGGGGGGRGGGGGLQSGTHGGGGGSCGGAGPAVASGTGGTAATCGSGGGGRNDGGISGTSRPLVEPSLAESISAAVGASTSTARADSTAKAANRQTEPVYSTERRNGEAAVLSARERYLQRKRLKGEGGNPSAAGE